jgi:hypothetical protein
VAAQSLCAIHESPASRLIWRAETHKSTTHILHLYRFYFCISPYRLLMVEIGE